MEHTVISEGKIGQDHFYNSTVEVVRGMCAKPRFYITWHVSPNAPSPVKERDDERGRGAEGAEAANQNRRNSTSHLDVHGPCNVTNTCSVLPLFFYYS